MGTVLRQLSASAIIGPSPTRCPFTAFFAYNLPTFKFLSPCEIKDRNLRAPHNPRKALMLRLLANGSSTEARAVAIAMLQCVTSCPKTVTNTVRKPNSSSEPAGDLLHVCNLTNHVVNAALHAAYLFQKVSETCPLSQGNRQLSARFYSNKTIKSTHCPPLWS